MNSPEPSSPSPSSTPAPIDPQLVPVKPAATVMLVRDALDGEPGVEVFMLRRTANAVFGAGMFVFPGGRVDGVDGAAGGYATRTSTVSLADRPPMNTLR